ncbi:MAG: sugar phosphate isomerase/epimerase family protein [Pseudomonadota bacterium]
MADAARTSLNTITTHRQWNLTQAVDGCLRHELQGITPWCFQLKEMGSSEAIRLLRESGLTITGLCGAGMLTGPDKATRRALLDAHYLAIDHAAEMGAACLVLVVGGLPDGSRDLAGARRQVRDALGQLLPRARAAGVALALEPLHPMYAATTACVNSLSQANDLCDELGEGLGIAVDVYHVWWDPQLEAEIQRAGADRLLAFHVCDWLENTRDLAFDRGMMGDGVIDLKQLRGWMERAGYQGCYEVEIFSDKDWWQRDGDEVLKTMKVRVASCL